MQNNNYLIWLFLYLGIGFAISFILPFPLSLAVSLLVFLLLNAVRTDIALRRQGIGGVRVCRGVRVHERSGVLGVGRQGLYDWRRAGRQVSERVRIHVVVDEVLLQAFAERGDVRLALGVTGLLGG